LKVVASVLEGRTVAEQ